ncbi:adenylate/guanylate cyclase domain-containing protein [Oceanivirga salmonicida]|uniref:adenylate/guanylate cyclase domain-containing protein n=1 Tax=Oceanivirga salmonicida TaxID=1769291 RepID=UPI0012E1A448|nr:adenylate/guanylate cyclase domain-containing protein [Oceanivirga salmonicida]
MAYYNYIEGKKRLEEILDNKLEIVEKQTVPSDENFTFSKAYYSWVTAIFVDVRDSSKLFSSNEKNKEKIAKVIQGFTSEVIEILRNDQNLREIGIRGDCVYAIFSTPTQYDIVELAHKTFYINTYMKMLNKLLEKRDLPRIKVGIGMSAAEELVIKAGRKNTGINSKVWIGEAVSQASNLSNIGNKDDSNGLVYSKVAYNNFIDHLDNNIKENFKYDYSFKYGIGYYSADLVSSNFNDWIDSGMGE